MPDDNILRSEIDQLKEQIHSLDKSLQITLQCVKSIQSGLEETKSTLKEFSQYIRKHGDEHSEIMLKMSRCQDHIDTAKRVLFPVVTSVVTLVVSTLLYVVFGLRGSV